MLRRTFVSILLLAVFVAAGDWTNLKVRPHVLLGQAPPALQSSDLAGLRLRSIGPATMSGRFVDMDVVESNPYTMYVASATGGLFRTTDNGITWTPVFEREAVHSI